MPRRDLTTQRLFVDAPLSPGAEIDCTPEQANYLVNVLRYADGAPIFAFNGRDGEWSARVVRVGKRAVRLHVETLHRGQERAPDIDYLFAPLKRARLDYMVQKATEMGAARLRPVITHRTIAERVNLERMRANVIEAAEQCAILSVPTVMSPEALSAVLATWDPARALVFCDEMVEPADPIAALRRLQPGPLAVLIGPEGGFTNEERALMTGQEYCCRISLGPRVLRADTAAVAALALVGAVLGDWSVPTRGDS
jgi:16S rRNA (uracil1498-N3)-methyltransferase